MKIVQVPIKELKPSEYNPRQMTEKQAKDLTESVKEFGLVDPLIINQHKGRENVVIGGHQRLKIASILGFKTIPVVYVDLEEKRERELNLRLNRNLGEWNYDLLANFSEEELNKVGFESEELDKIFQLGTDEDDFDAEVELEKIKEPKVKLGDLFQLGEHRLLCGDSTKKEDVEKLMGEEKADMVFTDPPFPNTSGIMKNEIVGIEIAFINARLFCKGKMFWFWDNIGEPPFNEKIVARHCWHKTNGWQAGHWEAINEYDGTEKRKECLVYSIANVGGQNIRENQGNHQTPKPIGLCREFVEKVKRNQIVLDLFGGSGSTLIACEQLNRKCFMMEIDNRYCEVILNRWQTLTNKKAEKI